MHTLPCNIGSSFPRLAPWKQGVDRLELPPQEGGQAGDRAQHCEACECLVLEAIKKLSPSKTYTLGNGGKEACVLPQRKKPV